MALLQLAQQLSEEIESLKKTIEEIKNKNITYQTPIDPLWLSFNNGDVNRHYYRYPGEEFGTMSLDLKTLRYDLSLNSDNEPEINRKKYKFNLVNVDLVEEILCKQFGHDNNILFEEIFDEELGKIIIKNDRIIVYSNEIPDCDGFDKEASIIIKIGGETYLGNYSEEDLDKIDEKLDLLGDISWDKLCEHFPDDFMKKVKHRLLWHNLFTNNSDIRYTWPSEDAPEEEAPHDNQFTRLIRIKFKFVYDIPPHLTYYLIPIYEKIHKVEDLKLISINCEEAVLRAFFGNRLPYCEYDDNVKLNWHIRGVIKESK